MASLDDYEALATLSQSCQKSSAWASNRRYSSWASGTNACYVSTSRVILDLEEKFPHEINFNMVEGGLTYSGTWRLEPYTLPDQMGTKLCYSVRVWPKRTMPVAILSAVFAAISGSIS